MSEMPPSSPFRIAVEAPEPCQRVVKIEVPRGEFDREYQLRLTGAVKDHQRPGFRRGKTPRAAVEKELGERLRVETFEAIMPRAYRAAVIEHELLPITDPQLDNMKFEEGEDLSFDLKVEVRPSVEAREYEGLPVEERSVEIKDEDVGEVLERLRDSRASFEKVARPARQDDQVLLDLTPLGDDGQPDYERKLKGQRLIVGAEDNLDAFNEVLAGVEAGEVKTAGVDYPEDYPNEDLRGRRVEFQCEILDIRQRVVPEADDAFASQLQEGQTLLELRGRIREGLEAEARKRVAREMEEQLVDGLIERNEVPVPPSMVETYVTSSLEDWRQRIQQGGREVTPEEEEKYREMAAPMAERSIRAMFLLEAVRRQEELEITPEEIEDRIVTIAGENGFDLEKFREFTARGEERDRIRHELEERKTVDFLLSRAEAGAAEAEPAEKETSGAEAGEGEG